MQCSIFFPREYEKELDEEAAKRHFIRIKKSQIQKDITENQLEKHIIRMVCIMFFFFFFETRTSIWTLFGLNHSDIKFEIFTAIK